MAENKKTEILRLLRESGDSISGQDLCRRFGISRTAIWKIMKQLQDEGYEIEAIRNKGYRLVGGPDLLSEADLISRMETTWAGKTIIYMEETDSTNTQCKRLAEAGLPHGTLVTADMQNGGKGRLGRAWLSPKGSSISYTLLLRPQIPPMTAPMLTLVMGLSVVQAISNVYGVDAGIKWPNDAVLNKKKLCGILTEMSVQIDAINYVVIGVGINANQTAFASEISQIATSLKNELGHDINRAELIAECMKTFEKNYQLFVEHQDLSALKDAYEAVLVNRNQPVRVLDPKAPFEGIAEGITAQGDLLVRKADGTLEQVRSGEVSVRGLYSYV